MVDLVGAFQIKCEEYWPSKGTLQCGAVYIKLEGERLFPEFTIRHLTVSTKAPAKSKEVSAATIFTLKWCNVRIPVPFQVPPKRSVTQFHFTSWPDFGVPQEASAMLKFVRRVRDSVEPSHGPMVVHCSAGVGRTGTFIAIDILLQRMKEEGCVLNVQEEVCRMRAQRGLMVQTNVSKDMMVWTLYLLCIFFFFFSGPVPVHI